MAQRLKVLISAYACEPGKGSEPEVGWQWAMQMARFHEVTVLTRANNRPVIEAALASLPPAQPVPRFVYHDRDPFVLALKRRLKIVKVYYLLWQRSAYEVVKRLNDSDHFDLMHHVTFAAFRYPTAVWGHGSAVVWGPVGGIESIPFRLLPWRHLPSLVNESLRNFSNMVQAAPYFSLPARARASALILASTVEMQQRFAEIGYHCDLMPTIGLDSRLIPFKPRANSSGPLKLLFVGNVITLKGIYLALEALNRSGTGAVFTIIGDGNYLSSARKLCDKLGIADLVRFEGRLPRDRVLARYGEFDVFVFPSLHDTGGYAVIEAMFNELPVICLDCGGPAVAVAPGCGIKVPLGSRAEVITGLANAIAAYDKDRRRLMEDGKKARRRVLDEYEWDQKGARMAEYYQKAIVGHPEKHNRTANEQKRAGFGTGTSLLNLLFSLRGVLMAAGGLLLVAALFFASLNYLKQQARSIVEDTLPGLSYAGEANASLGQAFNQTLLVMMNDSSEQRAELEKEIQQSSDQTTASLDAYKAQISSEKDRLVFEGVIAKRSDYLRIREDTLKFVNANQRAEAVTHCRTQLLPAFKAYKAEADRLFSYEMETGRSSGQAIMHICTGTQILVAVIGVPIFLAGFLIGLSR